MGPLDAVGLGSASARSDEACYPVAHAVVSCRSPVKSRRTIPRRPSPRGEAGNSLLSRKGEHPRASDRDPRFSTILHAEEKQVQCSGVPALLLPVTFRQASLPALAASIQFRGQSFGSSSLLFARSVLELCTSVALTRRPRCIDRTVCQVSIAPSILWQDFLRGNHTETNSLDLRKMFHRLLRFNLDP